ncbi:uncharacterized protein BT62DRAFT_1014170 [Guyanagaster necrorhizus]|uniref:Uncharacterized protein n=1 Tax=Guyanagaster necrorhizus TaxID=856835 RepID=A0A9P7VES2_9AGAR|nr:uncharacterized protein BT62DRAFT_1014170 [Guyanagaster necrorhizus MCA 3950]KAG7439262.1 hypothetical protein BT62DRAFT_1014170 [Guyanagaster necrorhizus MCA 3950]
MGLREASDWLMEASGDPHAHKPGFNERIALVQMLAIFFVCLIINDAVYQRVAGTSVLEGGSSRIGALIVQLGVYMKYTGVPLAGSVAFTAYSLVREEAKDMEREPVKTSTDLVNHGADSLSQSSSLDRAHTLLLREQQLPFHPLSRVRHSMDRYDGILALLNFGRRTLQNVNELALSLREGVPHWRSTGTAFCIHRTIPRRTESAEELIANAEDSSIVRLIPVFGDVVPTGPPSNGYAFSGLHKNEESCSGLAQLGRSESAAWAWQWNVQAVTPI